MQKNGEEETRWDWIPASQTIQTQFNGENQFLDLSPQIIITHPDGESYPDPIVKLHIDTEKSLQYTEDHGWNWHKSWNLPNITVRLEIKDSQTGDLLLSPKNIFAQLFAVKAVLENTSSFYLVDVGLRGTSKQELQDGQAFFSALRFASTSYNNEGVKFHLLLCIYIQTSDNELPKVLNTTISPPIFVDSRKTAKQSNERSACQFADPFPVDSLEKEFIKRENKRKSDHDIKIENDVDGLLNYLTAPNIRHKVKHPIFLTLKFSNCVKLYYNKSVMPQVTAQQIIEKMQTVLIRDYPSRNIGAASEDKQFIIQFSDCEDSAKAKKLSESTEYLGFPQVQIAKGTDAIPAIFELVDANDLLEAYKQNHEQIVVLTKQLQSKYTKELEYESESERSSDQSESEPKPVKKVKQSPRKIETKIQQHPVQKVEIKAKPEPQNDDVQQQQTSQQQHLINMQNQMANMAMQLSQQKAQQQQQQQQMPQMDMAKPQLQMPSKQYPAQDMSQINLLMQSLQQQPQLLQQLPYFQQMQQAALAQGQNSQLAASAAQMQHQMSQQIPQQMSQAALQQAAQQMSSQMVSMNPQQMAQMQSQLGSMNPQLQQQSINPMLWQQMLMSQEMYNPMNAMNPMLMYQQFMNPMMMQNPRMMAAANPYMQQQQLLLQQQMLRGMQQYPPNQGKPNIKDENQ